MPSKDIGDPEVCCACAGVAGRRGVHTNGRGGFICRLAGAVAAAAARAAVLPATGGGPPRPRDDGWFAGGVAKPCCATTAAAATADEAACSGGRTTPTDGATPRVVSMRGPDDGDFSQPAGATGSARESPPTEAADAVPRDGAATTSAGMRDGAGIGGAMGLAARARAGVDPTGSATREGGIAGLRDSGAAAVREAPNPGSMREAAGPADAATRAA
jgi:hypothetical protein